MYLVLGHQPSFGYDGSPTGLWYDQPPRIVMATEALSLLLTGLLNREAQWETTLCWAHYSYVRHTCLEVAVFRVRYYEFGAFF